MLATDCRGADLSAAERGRLCSDAVGAFEGEYQVNDKWKTLIPLVTDDCGVLGAAKYFGELGVNRAKDLGLPTSLILAMQLQETPLCAEWKEVVITEGVQTNQTTMTQPSYMLVGQPGGGKSRILKPLMRDIHSYHAHLGEHAATEPRSQTLEDDAEEDIVTSSGASNITEAALFKQLEEGPAVLITDEGNQIMGAVLEHSSYVSLIVSGLEGDTVSRARAGKQNTKKRVGTRVTAHVAFAVGWQMDSLGGITKKQQTSLWGTGLMSRMATYFLSFPRRPTAPLRDPLMMTVQEEEEVEEHAQSNAPEITGDDDDDAPSAQQNNDAAAVDEAEAAADDDSVMAQASSPPSYSNSESPPAAAAATADTDADTDNAGAAFEAAAAAAAANAAPIIAEYAASDGSDNGTESSSEGFSRTSANQQQGTSSRAQDEGNKSAESRTELSPCRQPRVSTQPPARGAHHANKRTVEEHVFDHYRRRGEIVGGGSADLSRHYMSTGSTPDINRAEQPARALPVSRAMYFATTAATCAAMPKKINCTKECVAVAEDFVREFVNSLLNADWRTEEFNLRELARTRIQEMLGRYFERMFKTAWSVQVVEIAEIILRTYVDTLGIEETISGDTIPDNFRTFVEDELNSLTLTVLVLSKRHMLSASFHTRYQLEHLLAGYSGLSLTEVLVNLQILHENDCANVRDGNIDGKDESPNTARAADNDEAEPENSATRLVSASDASLENVIEELKLPEVARLDYAVVGLAKGLFEMIASKVLLPRTLGSNLIDGDVPLSKVLNNLFATQDMYDATDRKKKYTSKSAAKPRSNTTTPIIKYQVSINAIRDVCARLKETGLLCETDDNYARRWTPPTRTFNDLSIEDQKTSALFLVKLKAATGSTLVRAELLRLYKSILATATETKKAPKPATARSAKRPRQERIPLDLEETDEDEAARNPAAAP